MSERTPDRAVAILGFHKIGEPPPDGWETWFYIPEETFVRQLRGLEENGWQVVDLASCVRGLAEPESLPARAALLTFDDGYRSFLEVALPRLVERGYPAVIFVPTDYIGGRNAFDADDEPDEAICGWDELRELERRGVSVQSHGASHSALSQLEPSRQRDELARSRAVLEDGLGKPVELFAYPYGDGGTGRAWRARRKTLRGLLEQAGYRAACLYGGGVQRFPVADRYRLARIAMGPGTDLGAELGG